MISSLINNKGKIVFNSKEAAKIFGENFLKCQVEHWGGYDTVIRYTLFSKILKIALNDGIISEEDFKKDDNFILEKIENSDDKKIKELLKYLENEDIVYEIDKENPQISTKKKFRYVDPEYLENGEIKRLSQEDKDFNNLIEEKRNENEKLMNIRLKIDI